MPRGERAGVRGAKPCRVSRSQAQARRILEKKQKNGKKLKKNMEKGTSKEKSGKETFPLW